MFKCCSERVDFAVSGVACAVFVVRRDVTWTCLAKMEGERPRKACGEPIRGGS